MALDSDPNVARFRAYSEIYERETRKGKLHPSTRLFRDSNWPYTDRLDLQEIACMRDSYCGNRIDRTLPVIERVRVFDRVNRNTEQTWDQYSHKSNLFHKTRIQRSSKDEEKYRPLPVTGNHVYGQRNWTFYDAVSMGRPGGRAGGKMQPNKVKLNSLYFDVTDDHRRRKSSL